jgi:predicted ArsR family transcriptional regulator
VAERFPEVCHEELRFLEEVLGTRVERQSHIISGCNSCEYTVSTSGEPVQLTRAPRAPDSLSEEQG